MTLAVLRIRGGCRTNQDIRDTMTMLRLTRQNHLVFIPRDKVMAGMLQKIKDYVTWGEVDPETLLKLINLRGRLVGDRPITDEYIKANSSYATAKDFAAAIVQGKAKFADLKDVKPVLRLHPPRGGFENTKLAFKVGGSLGYRGKEIGSLLLKMLGPGKTEMPAKAPAAKPILKRAAVPQHPGGTRNG